VTVPQGHNPLSDLRLLLENRFDVSELRALCFDLGIEYDGLAGPRKTSRVTDLVALLNRQNRIPELVEVGRQLRPDIDWKGLVGDRDWTAIHTADLEQSIRESYHIVREYETIIRTTDRPEEEVRAWRIIREQTENVAGYLEEYRAAAHTEPDAEVAQMAESIAALCVPEPAPETRLTELDAPQIPGQPIDRLRDSTVIGPGAQVVTARDGSTIKNVIQTVVNLPSWGLAILAAGLIVAFVAAAVILTRRQAPLARHAGTPEPVSAAPTASPSVMCPTPRTHSASADLDRDMVQITGTTFSMGDNDVAPPRHQVRVESFLIDRFEVTNMQYRRFVQEDDHRPPASWKAANYPTDSAFHPVVGVAWHDAVAYCKWADKRLPTEAEWELACRGTENRHRPWGDESDLNRANSSGSSCGDTITVGSYSPHGDTMDGISDMLGNAAEWTGSIYMVYPYQRDDGREDPSDTEAYRAVRGGSFELDLLGCGQRLSAPPALRKTDVGFRCAKSLTVSP
jgi:formylglycine-generating enzyme required for sulfatase activity